MTSFPRPPQSPGRLSKPVGMVLLSPFPPDEPGTPPEMSRSSMFWDSMSKPSPVPDAIFTPPKEVRPSPFPKLEGESSSDYLDRISGITPAPLGGYFARDEPPKEKGTGVLGKTIDALQVGGTQAGSALLSAGSALLEMHRDAVKSIGGIGAPEFIKPALKGDIAPWTRSVMDHAKRVGIVSAEIAPTSDTWYGQMYYDAIAAVPQLAAQIGLTYVAPQTTLARGAAFILPAAGFSGGSQVGESFIAYRNAGFSEKDAMTNAQIDGTIAAGVTAATELLPAKVLGIIGKQGGTKVLTNLKIGTIIKVLEAQGLRAVALALFRGAGAEYAQEFSEQVITGTMVTLRKMNKEEFNNFFIENPDWMSQMFTGAFRNGLAGMLLGGVAGVGFNIPHQMNISQRVGALNARIAEREAALGRQSTDRTEGQVAAEASLRGTDNNGLVNAPLAITPTEEQKVHALDTQTELRADPNYKPTGIMSLEEAEAHADYLVAREDVISRQMKVDQEWQRKVGKALDMGGMTDEQLRGIAWNGNRGESAALLGGVLPSQRFAVTPIMAAFELASREGLDDPSTLPRGLSMTVKDGEVSDAAILSWMAVNDGDARRVAAFGAMSRSQMAKFAGREFEGNSKEFRDGVAARIRRMYREPRMKAVDQVVSDLTGLSEGEAAVVARGLSPQTVDLIARGPRRAQPTPPEATVAEPQAPTEDQTDTQPPQDAPQDAEQVTEPPTERTQQEPSTARTGETPADTLVRAAEVNGVDPDSLRIVEGSGPLMDRISAVATARGIDVSWWESDNPKVLTAAFTVRNRVFLRADGGNEAWAYATAVHETLDALMNADPELRRELSEAVKTAAPDAYATIVKAYGGRLRDQAERAGRTALFPESSQDREGVSNTADALFMAMNLHLAFGEDGKLDMAKARALVSSNPGVFAKVILAIRRALARLGIVPFNDAQSKALERLIGSDIGELRTPAVRNLVAATLLDALKASESVRNGEVSVSPEVLAQSVAFHGGPSRFDKFSAEKIGTGEGGQAFGWGHYFAGRREVAEHYRAALSGREFEIANGRWIVDGGTTRALDAQSPAEHIAAEALNIAFDAQSSDVAGYASNYLRRAGKVYPESDADVDAALDVILAWQDGGSKSKKGGALYTVDLKPAEDEYLLWDKPLSEQSDKVKKAIGKIDEETWAAWEDRSGQNAPVVAMDANTGADLVRGLGRVLDDPAYASAALLKVGIRGVKYLDGGSRAAGEGSYNYVIFDDADVEITAQSVTQPFRTFPEKNYLVDLSKYAPRMYQETRLADAELLLPSSVASRDMTFDQVHLAESPEMALGQGDNKGVILEFDSRGLHGHINTSKPMLRQAFENGNGEFIGLHSRQSQYQDALVSVTVKKDAKTDRMNRIIMRRSLASLESSGWTKTDNADGSVTYRRPEVLAQSVGEVAQSVQKDGEKKTTELETLMLRAGVNPEVASAVGIRAALKIEKQQQFRVDLAHEMGRHAGQLAGEVVGQKKGRKDASKDAARTARTVATETREAISRAERNVAEREQRNAGRMRRGLNEKIDKLKARLEQGVVDEKYQREVRRWALGAVQMLPRDMRAAYISAISKAGTDAATLDIGDRVSRDLTMVPMLALRNMVDKRAKRMLGSSLRSASKEQVKSLMADAKALLSNDKGGRPGYAIPEHIRSRIAAAEGLIAQAEAIADKDSSYTKDESTKRGLALARDIDGASKALAALDPLGHETATGGRERSFLAWATGTQANMDIHTFAAEAGAWVETIFAPVRNSVKAMHLDEARLRGQFETILQKYGFGGREDYMRRATDIYGESAADMVTANIGGKPVIVTLDLALNIAASDVSASARLVSGIGFVFGRDRNAVPMKISSDEMAALRTQLGDYYKMAQEIKAATSASITERLLETIFRLTNKQPKRIDDYLRTHRHSDAVAGEITQGMTPDAMVNHVSTHTPMAEERVNSPSPFVMDGFMSVIDSTLDDGLRYIHVIEPAQHAMRVLQAESVRTGIARSFGDKTNDGIRAILLNGARLNVTSRGDIIEKLSTLTTGAIIMIRPTTMLRQFGGEFKLGTEIEAEHIAIGSARSSALALSGGLTKFSDEVKAKNGYAMERWNQSQVDRIAGVTGRSKQGRHRIKAGLEAMASSLRKAGHDVAASKFSQAARDIKDSAVAASVALRALDAGLRLVDQKVFATAVFAFESKINDEAPGQSPESVRNQAILLAEMAFRKTQNSSDPMDDTVLMAKSKARGGPLRLLLPFSSDPLKSYNQVRRAFTVGGAEERARALFAIGANSAWSSFGVTAITTAATAALLATSDRDEIDKEVLMDDMKSSWAYNAGMRAGADVASTMFGHGGMIAGSMLDGAIRSGQVDVASNVVAFSTMDKAFTKIIKGDIVKGLWDASVLAGNPLPAFVDVASRTFTVPDDDKTIAVLRKNDRNDGLPREQARRLDKLVAARDRAYERAKRNPSEMTEAQARRLEQEIEREKQKGRKTNARRSP